MIAKERDLQEHGDDATDMSAAGAAAERQMAFYLKREFEPDRDVVVFNDLRFKADTDDVAQIDHLVLHRHGFVLIESKSVSTKVKVNRHGEWERWWNGRFQGMASPIEQVRRQAKFLDRALDANAAEMLPKMLGLVQCRFGAFPTDVLVAISDSGSIQRECEVPEVLKADQVPGKIRDLIRKHRSSSSLLNLKSDATLTFSADAMERIANFLLDHHYPRSIQPSRRSPPVVATPPPPLIPPPLPTAPVQEGNVLTRGEPCGACGVETRMTWGRYGYYWKCPAPACGRNTPLQHLCGVCQGKLYLRKDGNRYFARCEKCKSTEWLYAELA